jgi:uncharacterized membrane protein
VPSDAVDGTAGAVSAPPYDRRVRRSLPVLSRGLRRAVTAPPGSVWRDPVIWAIAAAAFGAYFVISLYRLLTLTPSSYDLGIFTEFVRQLSQLHAPIDDVWGPGYNFEGDHFEIAVGVIAPFFRLFPTPATLLFFQALFAAVSVFPVAAVAILLTGKSSGRLIAFAYAFSWGLQQMIDFDFHEVALAVPLLAFSVSALVRRRPGAAIGWALPLVFVKEDQGFTVAAIGALLCASAAFPRLFSVGAATSAGSRPPLPDRPGGEPAAGGDPGDYRYGAMWGGLFLVGWGLFWSMVAITLIIPHFNPEHVYRFFSEAGGTTGGTIGGGSAGSFLVQAGGNWPTKGQTLAMLLLPTAFVALGSPVALLAVPSLLLRFVSTDPTYWGTSWHYNATVMPILFIAAAEAIGRWRRTRAGPASGFRSVLRSAQTGLGRHGGAMMAAIAVALAFQFPLSALWHSSTYQIAPYVAADDAAMAVVPDGATVMTTTDLLAPLAARTDTFWIGNTGNPATQYIVFDGNNSGYAPAITNVPAYIQYWYGKDGYKQIFSDDDVYVFRRG